MSNTAPVVATALSVDSAESIVQSINELRQEQCLIDIHVELSAVVVPFYTLFHAGITREGVRGSQGCPCSPLPRPQEPSNAAIRNEPYNHQLDALLRRVSTFVIVSYKWNRFAIELWKPPLTMFTLEMSN